MRCILCLLIACTLEICCVAQVGTPTLKTSTTIVEVPVTVHSAEGTLVHGLQATDFTLYDNGLPQAFRVEESQKGTLSVVVLLQTGGAAARQFVNYRGLGTMLEYAFARTPYRISLVTFDSKPEDRWPFSPSAGNLHTAFEQPTAGDRGAAVLDAVEYGLDWFDNQHVSGRRLLILIGQEHFSGDAVKLRHTVQRLTETNTAVSSLTFSVEKTWLKDQFTKERHENPPYFFAPDHAPLVHTFNLDAPLRIAMGSLRTNGAETLAEISGGVCLPFGDQQALQRQVLALTNTLANQYVLSFNPMSSTEGLHQLEVKVTAKAGTGITARTRYWRSNVTPQDQPR